MEREPINQTDQILNSLDGIQRATVNDFFYTRLKARIEKERPATSFAGKWLLRPAFVVTALLVVLLINAAVLLMQGSGESTVMNTDNKNLRAIESVYYPGDNLSYDLNN